MPGDQPKDVNAMPGDVIFTIKTKPHTRFERFVLYLFIYYDISKEKRNESLDLF